MMMMMMMMMMMKSVDTMPFKYLDMKVTPMFHFHYSYLKHLLLRLTAQAITITAILLRERTVNIKKLSE